MDWGTARKELNLPRPNIGQLLVFRTTYIKDSSCLHGAVANIIRDHLGPFRATGYYNSSTKFKIDSIIYSPDKKRLVVIVINSVNVDSTISNHHQSISYNANYFCCERDIAESKIRVYPISSYTLGNCSDYGQLETDFYFTCFFRMATGNNTFPVQYNLNDVRFWSEYEFNYIVKNVSFVLCE